MRHNFRAMGTCMGLIGPDDSDPGRFAQTAQAVIAIFAEQERRFSRFIDDSELSRVNRSAGSWTQVSADFATVTRLALDAAARSAGLFDPTVLPALRAAGYDRDFDLVGKGDTAAGRVAAVPPVCGRWRDVALDGCNLFLPSGVELDFGGLAKGWTSDIAAERAAEMLDWALIDAGGDLRVAGSAPVGGLLISIDDPFGAGDMPQLRLTHGAVATSSTRKRSWGDGMHHLIDPRTSLPARVGSVQATAWAPTCAEAEVAAKWALLGGPEVLQHVHAVRVTSGGDLISNLEAA